MVLSEAVTNMTYGNKFVYRDNTYMLIDFDLSNCFLSRFFEDLIMALDMSTYKVVALDKSWEVEV